MVSSGIIKHSGIISEITGKTVKVRVRPEAACSGCRARGSCSIGENEDRIIEVFTSPDEQYRTGEKITVLLEQSHGLKALALGYIVPFLILMTVLTTLVSFGVNEGLAGILSLLSLVPWYGGLSFFRHRLKREFSFRLQKT